MKQGKLNILLDGQWGSCGKGLFAGYLAVKENIDIAITARGPNSGGWYKDRMVQRLHKQLPSSVINLNTTLMLSSNSVIDVEILLHEIEENRAGDRLHIHPLAPVITEMDKKSEEVELRYVASTMQGTGAAIARKIMRKGVVAREVPQLQPWVREDWDEMLYDALIVSNKLVLMELPQGYGLSLNGHFYPYCTSRNVTVSAALDYCGLPPSMLGDVYGLIRTYPIRVGNIPGDAGSYSGGCFEDQVEITWEDVSKACGKSVKELTTVTKRVRRVFTFSSIQLSEFILNNDVTHLCINFMNYLGRKDSEKVTEFINCIETVLEGCELSSDRWGKTHIDLLGWGEKAEDIQQL